MDGTAGLPIHYLDFRVTLKAEPKLKFRDTPGERAQRAAEVSPVSEIRVAPSARLKGRQVQNVEDVEKVSPDFQVGRFTKM